MPRGFVEAHIPLEDGTRVSVKGEFISPSLDGVEIRTEARADAVAKVIARAVFNSIKAEMAEYLRNRDR